MADFLRFPLSSQARGRFEHLLERAASLGIAPTKVTEAGPVAFRALLALTRAKDSESGPQREHYLAKVQDTLRVLEHRQHPDLVQQIQRAVIALHGRMHDSEVAHVTQGEIVVPRQLQNTEVLDALQRAAAPYGVPLDMLRVGTALNRINPGTGAPEFGVIDWISGLFSDDEKKLTSPPSNERIIFSPPFDDPAIAAEEEEAVRAYLREFPPERRPILRNVYRAIKPIHEWLNEGEQRNLQILESGPPRG